jgi:peptidoglycan hydrolase-like protein with peptidoglycan-binding domain
MRRLNLLAGALVALALAAPLSAAASNTQLAGFQVALRAFGIYRGPIDGIAGPATVAAARSFQRRHGLPATGLADARTRKALGPLGQPLLGRRTLRRGRFGWDVSVVQFLLTRAGFYHGALDGYFDAATGQALRRYQQAGGLRADGVVGSRTLATFALDRSTPVAGRRIAAPARYRVRVGDTLTGIAARFGTTVGALARANRLRRGDVLLAGSSLAVPATTAPQPSSPTAIRMQIDRTAARYGVDLHLARALAWMESGYQPHVVSSVGAAGVMQILPVTRAFVETSLLARPVPHTASGNIEIGVVYLRYLLREFDGDTKLALAAWYQGPHSVRTNGVLAVSHTFVRNVLALRERL